MNRRQTAVVFDANCTSIMTVYDDNLPSSYYFLTDEGQYIGPRQAMLMEDEKVYFYYKNPSVKLSICEICQVIRDLLLSP